MVFILPFGNVRIMTVLVLALITTVVPSPIPQAIPANQGHSTVQARSDRRGHNGEWYGHHNGEWHGPKKYSGPNAHEHVREHIHERRDKPDIITLGIGTHRQGGPLAGLSHQRRDDKPDIVTLGVGQRKGEDSLAGLSHFSSRQTGTTSSSAAPDTPSSPSAPLLSILGSRRSEGGSGAGDEIGAVENGYDGSGNGCGGPGTQGGPGESGIQGQNGCSAGSEENGDNDGYDAFLPGGSGSNHGDDSTEDPSYLGENDRAGGNGDGSNRGDADKRRNFPSF